ncbi:MAG: sensor histidine kinase [Alphaproteobacteria bacterium]
MSGSEVMILTGRPRDAELLGRVLADAGIGSRSVQDIRDVCAGVAEAGAALIAEERLDDGGLPGLRNALGLQPAWSDLPLLVMLRAGGADPDGQIRRAEALLPTGKPVLLERPLRVATLLSAIRSALAARQRQYQIRMFLEERAQRERELAAGEERYRLAALATREAIWEWNIPSDRLIHGPAIADISGAPPDSVSRMAQWLERVHPDDRERVRDARDRALGGTGDQWQDEYRIARAGGGFADVLDRGYVVRDGAGRPVRMIGALADVTERKRAEAQQRLLLAELNHRVRNILAVITALASQTLRRSRDLGEFAEAFIGRLQALSRVHGLLTKAHWTTTSLDAIAREAVAPHGEAGHRIEIRGPDVAMAPRFAQAFSMLFHELCTNAAKYGALAGEGGSLRLHWRIDGTRLVIDWIERGGPAVEQPTRRGFGSILIEQTVRFELKGTCERRFDPEGFSCRIDLPWPPTA